MTGAESGWYWQALSVGTALACGLLIGIERGWKPRDEKPGTRVAGVRTFTILGLGSGIAGLLGSLGELVVAAALAIACAAVGVALLALREELHHLVERLDADDVKALARYAVIAGAILPFLPNGNYGPLGAWNPQRLWLVVVLVTGFSFLGYVANRIFGERHGTIATALIGGAYSSTAVTQALAQRLGKEAKPGAEPAGIALASGVMYLRVPILIAIFATRVLQPILVLLAPAIVVAWGAGFWLYRKAPKCDAPTPPGNPIKLIPAFGFVLFVAVAAVSARWAAGRFGEHGIALLLLTVGSTDIDTAIITLGGLQPEAISSLLAAIAIAGTIIVNMAVKMGIILAYAGRRGQPAVTAMALSVVALAITIGLA